MAARDSNRDASVEQVIRDINRGQTMPVYIFHGPNSLLIEKAIERLKAKIVGDNVDFAYSALRAEEVKGVDIVAVARTVPMLAEEQLIVVRHADALSSDDQAALLAYLEAPNPSTCLVLVAEKVDKRFKLFLQANKLGFLFEAAALSERDLGGWISSRARSMGLRMSPNVAQLVGEATGTDTATIEDALERIRLYADDRAEITADDVEAVVSASRVRSIFELTDALGRRDVAVALRTLSNMLQNREPALKILATLATQMRRVVMAKALLDTIPSQSPELASELKVPPFLARKLADQADHFSKGELKDALLRLAQTDLELKSARRSDEIILEEMVLDLCLKKQSLGRARFRS